MEFASIDRVVENETNKHDNIVSSGVYDIYNELRLIGTRPNLRHRPSE
ncbi:hypothetical protein [uncultured Sphingomonas sp.]